ncbi:MAG: diguanylate cyclase [Candidatus Methylomirabilales bacterium]
MGHTQILVVEDENIVAKDLQQTLRTLGYGVPVIASSGEEAIEKAAATRPDLVLMDIKLKGRLDGVAAAGEISDRLDIPVVYLTAYADEQTLRRAKVTEPFGYLVKPFDERSLHAAIEVAIHRHRMQMTLRSLAHVDELTGVYNRRGFLTLAKQHLKVARRTKRALWLIFVDLDGFKAINDQFGHREGDLALIKTAEILRKTFRDSDVIARLGGDEFTVLAIHASEDSAEMMTARLQENLRAVNARSGRRYELGFSMGVARFDPKAMGSIEQLLAKADEALYEEKRSKQQSLQA